MPTPGIGVAGQNTRQGYPAFSDKCIVLREERGSEIASVDLEVQTYPFDEPSCELALTAE